MKETMLVHVLQTLNHLVHNGLDFVLRKSANSVFHKLVNVLHHVFKHEVEVVVNTDNFLQLDDLLVVEFS